METVAIFGVGLIGGSFALALRKAGFNGKLLGVSSPQTLERALELGVIDAASPPDEAAAADLIYLAEPIHRIIERLPDLNRWAKSGALITDAGSTKGTVVQEAARLIDRCQFLGGHPLAGKEQRGVDAADPDLFAGRKYVFTPRADSETNTPIAADFLDWIVKIGAIPVILRPEEHDRAVAYTSHLPQLAATAIAALFRDNDAALQVSGPALIDMTRLALSPFETWHDIFATNKSAIQQALSNYIRTLQAFSVMLDSQRMREQFDRAANAAKRLRSDAGSLPEVNNISV
jgi:prephenate dehydrogenase